MKKFNTNAEKYYILSGLYSENLPGDTRTSKNFADEDLKFIRKAADGGSLAEYAAVIVHKDDDGKMQVHQSSSNAKGAAAAGFTLGAIPAFVLAIAVPPAGVAMLGAGIIAGASMGGIFGAIGHYRNGFSKEALEEISDRLDASEVALIVVARENTNDGLDSILANADSRTCEELDSDELDGALVDMFIDSEVKMEVSASA